MLTKRICVAVAIFVAAIVMNGQAALADDPEYNPYGNDIEINPTDPGSDPDAEYDPYSESDSGPYNDTSPDGTSDTDINDGPCGADVIVDPGLCGGTGGPNPDDGGEQPGPIFVDPGELAQETLDSLPLPAPEVHMAPAGTGGAPSLVNLPTWLWVGSGWTSLSKSATAGQTTVSVTVDPVRVDWDMSAGSVSCSGAGTPWTGGNQEHSPSGCDYTYAATGDYDTSATIQFQANWTCTGFCLADSGTLGTVAGPSTATPVEVSERQSVVIQ